MKRSQGCHTYWGTSAGPLRLAAKLTPPCHVPASLFASGRFPRFRRPEHLLARSLLPTGFWIR